MADGTQPQSTDLVVAKPQARAIATGPAAFDTGKFDQMVQIAKMMALAKSTPEHVKSQDFNEAVANCFAVVEQAYRWQMSPFALVQGTYFVHGKIGFEGKVIAAALEQLTGIKLKFKFSGKEGTPERSIKLWDPNDPERDIEGTVKQWATPNDKWKTQPDDQLIYRGTRQWCRRHEAGVILGVYTTDELEDAASSDNRLGSPPPAPARQMIAATKVEDAVVDEPIENPDGYIANLEESLVCANKDPALIAEVLDNHKPLHARLPQEQRQQADALFVKYNKEAAQAALKAKSKPKSDPKPAPEKQRDILDLTPGE